MYRTIFLSLFIVFDFKLTHCLETCPKDWIPYKDKKCFKVLNQTGTQYEAIDACHTLDTPSILITIHSKEEEDFVTNLLKEYNTESERVWIGLKYMNGSNYTKWMDGSGANFESWSKESVKDGSEPCVQMSITSLSLGKWTDESCMKKALFMCQINQEWDVKTLKILVETLSKQIIPIGFIYTQLSGQPDAHALWPDLVWSDVTGKYAGQFFRAEGGGSLPFGQVQQGDSPRITKIHTGSCPTSSGDEEARDHDIPLGAWSEEMVRMSNKNNLLHRMNVYTTGVETRPVNSAIRLWMRTK